MAISVVIPSYKNPEYLDLCLRSAFENQVNDNEIIVILDGYADLSRHVIEKYPALNVIEFPENRGQIVAHNTGVALASYPYVLIVNDDNVFPPAWDVTLESVAKPNRVVAPNQIEPTPSIFSSFVIKNYGTTPDTFDIEAFCECARRLEADRMTVDGQTWPVFMQKKAYMMLGGIDPSYPSAAVADWDFFFRCELAGLELVRSHKTHFYHFAGAATKKPELVNQHVKGEHDSFQYFAWKWGFLPQLEAGTHNKRPFAGAARGIEL